MTLPEIGWMIVGAACGHLGTVAGEIWSVRRRRRRAWLASAGARSRLKTFGETVEAAETRSSLLGPPERKIH